MYLDGELIALGENGIDFLRVHATNGIAQAIRFYDITHGRSSVMDNPYMSILKTVNRDGMDNILTAIVEVVCPKGHFLATKIDGLLQALSHSFRINMKSESGHIRMDVSFSRDGHNGNYDWRVAALKYLLNGVEGIIGNEVYCCPAEEVEKLKKALEDMISVCYSGFDSENLVDAIIEDILENSHCKSNKEYAPLSDVVLEAVNSNKIVKGNRIVGMSDAQLNLLTAVSSCIDQVMDRSCNMIIDRDVLIHDEKLLIVYVVDSFDNSVCGKAFADVLKNLYAFDVYLPEDAECGIVIQYILDTSAL